MSLRQIHTLLQAMQQQLQQTAPVQAQLLVELVDQLRPSDLNDVQQLDAQFDLFWHAIAEYPQTLGEFILRLLDQYQQHLLYSDCGIWSLDGFWNQLLQRIGAYLLPPVAEPQQARTLLARVFHNAQDAEWMAAIAQQHWVKLWLLLQQAASAHQQQHLQQQLLKAITVLSYRISGIGLYPELLHVLPELSEYESPFLAQNREILWLIEQLKPHYAQDDNQHISVAPSLVMLEQCREMLFKVRRACKKNGVSMSLTYMLTVLEQCLDRIDVLLQLLIPHRSEAASHLQLICHDLVEGHHQAHSVQALLRSTSELIALQVTENASKTGENYVSSDRKGFFQMYRAAAGAGAIIAVMATLKSLTARLSLAPLQQAFLYSMNYSLGFVFIHVLHFTVATKQPAMTAAALASTLQQQQGRKNPQLTELAALSINIIRTQFIAILGNISIAMPVAAIIVIIWGWGADAPLLTHAKALKNLHELNPFTSMALPHAAIAGVCLFLSGLIAGFFDNFAVYRDIGSRLAVHPFLLRRLGVQRTARFAYYVQTNLGALAGNFLFGIMLGSMGTLGMILGLPLDIRHIAFASANMVQGLMCLNDANDLGLILVSFLGVLLIGLTNLIVSFSLTIFVALRARRVRFSMWKPLLGLIFTHFSTRPRDFFWPTQLPPSATTDTASAQIHLKSTTENNDTKS